MGLILEALEIKTFRGINNYSIENLGPWCSITGPNSTSKSSILCALSFLGSDRMHELSDIPADIRVSEINPFEVPISVSYIFRLVKNFDKILSNEKVTELLFSSYESQLKNIQNKGFEKSLENYFSSMLTELKSRKPLSEFLNNALYSAIREEIEPYPIHEKDKFLFYPAGHIKDSKQILHEGEFLRIDLELSLSDGPSIRFFLLDKNKNIIVDDEVFYHWISRMKVITDDITLAYVIGATYILSVLPKSQNVPKYLSTEVVLISDGSNICQYIEYLLLHHPEKLHEFNLYFQKIFDSSIKFKKGASDSCIDSENQILVDLGDKNIWFSLSKLSDGMLHTVKILLLIISCTKNNILVIDEPELHLHPGAIKSLRNILFEKKSDIQIICATHSPLFLEPAIINTIILNQKDTRGELKPKFLDKTNFQSALSELGTSGLDILLFDVILWIEGPSDELYIDRWLFLLSNQLKNVKLSDIGYIRYGGADMLKHFDVEKIKLINRKSIFIIDSDKASSTDQISDIKKEFLQKCQTNDIYCWLTKKREMENYIPITLLENKLLLPTGSLQISEFDDVFQKLKEQGKNRKKVELANLIASDITLNDIQNDQNLKTELNELIKKINSF